MANAIDAYKEAFGAFQKNAVDFAVYSLLFFILALILAGISLLAFFVVGAILAGSASSAAGNGISTGLVVLAILGIVLLVGALLLGWVASNITGAYLDTLNMLLVGKKQTFNGFISSIPKRATPLLVLHFVQGIVVGVPLVAIVFGGAALGLFSNILLQLALLAVALIYALIVGVLFFFTLPAIVIDDKEAFAGIKASVSLSLRNFLQIIVFWVVSALLAIPMIIPGVNLLYSILLYLPLMYSALIIFYKKAK